jgi:hypothetical protein
MLDLAVSLTGMSNQWSWLYPCLFHPFSWLPIPCLFTAYAPPIHCPFEPIHYLFTAYSLPIPWLFLTVLVMLWSCSNDVMHGWFLTACPPVVDAESGWWCSECSDDDARIILDPLPMVDDHDDDDSDDDDARMIIDPFVHGRCWIGLMMQWGWVCDCLNPLFVS